MIWEELTKIALIGAERGKLPEEVLEALSRLGIDTEGDPARMVLEGAALYQQFQRAGFPLSSYRGEPMQWPTAQADQRTNVSGKSARQLKRILEGLYHKVLPEYLQMLQAHQKRIPAEHLPSLYYLCLDSGPLWKELQEALGPAERWLLRQNPDWGALADNPDIEEWPGAKPEEQLAMLRYVRRTQPEEAAVLLESSWSENPYTQKQALLKEMEVNLGPYDEPFLEACLNDGRKQVRNAAALLLAQLPGSALLERLYSYAQTLFRQKKGGNLAFQLPEKLDEGLKRDGIGAGKKPYPGGQRAGWAFELMSRIPPKRWEAYFNQATVDSLRRLAASNRKALLLDALANAAVLHQDHRWIEAILRYWWRTNEEAAWAGSRGKLLMAHLPGPAFNDMALQQLKQNPGFIEEGSFLQILLCQNAHYWNKALAQLVLQGFQQWLSGARAHYWNLWHYKRILEVAAYRIDPALLETFRTGWDTRSPVWYHWEKGVDRFLKVLAFRKEMMEEVRFIAG